MALGALWKVETGWLKDCKDMRGMRAPESSHECQVLVKHDEAVKTPVYYSLWEGD